MKGRKSEEEDDGEGSSYGDANFEELPKSKIPDSPESPPPENNEEEDPEETLDSPASPEVITLSSDTEGDHSETDAMPPPLDAEFSSDGGSKTRRATFYILLTRSERNGAARRPARPRED